MGPRLAPTVPKGGSVQLAEMTATAHFEATLFVVAAGKVDGAFGLFFLALVVAFAVQAAWTDLATFAALVVATVFAVTAVRSAAERCGRALSRRRTAVRT